MNTRYLPALIPLVAIACFYLVRPRTPVNGGHGGSSAIRSESFTTSARTPEEVAAATAENRKRIEGQLADAASYEMQREIDEAAFAVREPNYRALFSRWGIGEAAANRALSIIKERERQKGIMFVRYLKAEGREGSGKELTLSSEVEGVLAEQELVKLLGENRHRELARLDEKMNHEIATRARLEDD
ncbi:hypothetical protein [Prosthecobacter sp.]|uniref:hypothetical protein n=1 Tax=Prosthecobacter sp. TaxID=1965333 RepID=UPI003784340D